MAQCALYFVILTPVVEEFRLEGFELGSEGWAVGIGGGVLCLILCELYKAAAVLGGAELRTQLNNIE